jgi:hypothetical protein
MSQKTGLGLLRGQGHSEWTGEFFGGKFSCLEVESETMEMNRTGFFIQLLRHIQQSFE